MYETVFFVHTPVKPVVLAAPLCADKSLLFM
jgi:hypothetical protein